MHTQEVVCPGCGKPAIVNVIKDKTTSTPCQHCKKTIQVRANRESEIVDIRIVGCFITTACVNARHNDPNGEHILNVLRTYRDEYVRTLNEGGRLLEHYYDIAPRIVDSINNRSNSSEIFEEIYAKHLVAAVVLIEFNRNDEALKIYSSLVSKLEEDYLRF